MRAPSVNLDISHGIGEIVLDRPPMNALDLEMAQELCEKIRACVSDPRVSAILLKGAHQSFCAGGDVKVFAAQEQDLSAYVTTLTRCLHSSIGTLVSTQKPVIAAVNGPAAGAGLGLLCACDIVIAGRSSRFTLAYSAVGLTPDAGVTYLLPRLIGLRRTLDLALTNRSLSASEAEAWGLVSSVVEDKEVHSATRELALSLANGASNAIGVTKLMLRSSGETTLEDRLARESQEISLASGSNEARTRIAAFAERENKDRSQSP